jgi:hypothetical protein
MSTAFSAVVSAIMATLSAAPAVCDTIYRARPSVVPDQTDRAVNVQFEGALPNRGAMNGAPVDWTTKISVECFARSTVDAGDVAVDPLLAAVYARLAQDTTLGGLVDDFDGPGIEAENTSEGKKTGWVRLTYLVQHRTSNLTLN